MTQNHFYYGNADMERYLARINAHDGKRTDSPILHFESFFDMELIKEVMQDCPDEFKSLNKNLEYRYTKTKKRAIRNHSQALEMGHDISTLVDMDHDIKSKDFRKKKGSSERIQRIHTTKPACTLRTTIYTQNGVHDEETFTNAIRTIPELRDSNINTINEIKDNAVKRTWERLKKGIWQPKAKERLEKEFTKEKISSPINDHDLQIAITEKCKNTEQNKVRDMLDVFYKRQSGKNFSFLRPILSDFE